jgi:hypothetical protein
MIVPACVLDVAQISIEPSVIAEKTKSTPAGPGYRN